MINIYTYLGIMIAASGLLSGYMFMASKVRLSVKTALAFVSASLSIAIWLTVAGIFGYPVDAKPPDGSVVLYDVPDKAHGSIYLWIEGSPPRAYRVPYTEAFSAQLDNAEDNAQKTNGKIVIRGGGGTGPNTQGVTNIQGNEGEGLTIEVVPILPKKS